MIVDRSSPLSHLLLVGLLLLPAGSALATRISVDGTVKMEDGSAVAAVQILVLAPDEALVIRGRFPECRFANLVLWNRHIQTFDYRAPGCCTAMRDRRNCRWW